MYNPLAVPILTGSLFGGSLPANAPKPFSPGFPSTTTYGLPPAASTLGTGNFGSSTSPAFSDLFGSSALPLGAGAKPKESTSFSSLFGNNPPFRAVPDVDIPTGTTASASNNYISNGTTPPINVMQSTATQTSPIHVSSHKSLFGNTPHTKRPKANAVNLSSAAKSASSLERERRPYSNHGEILRSGQTCTRCKVVHLFSGLCDCDQRPPLNKSSKQ